MSLEWLLNGLRDGWARITPLVEIVPFEGGGVTRFGRYHRTLGEGWHWKWPVVELVHEVTTCRTTLRLPPQSLTTKDGVEVVAAVMIAYEIKDVQPYITKIFDQNDVLADTAMGAVLDAVESMDYADLIASPPKKRVLDLVRDEVNQFGFKVYKVTFTDLAKMRSIRLIQPHSKDLAN